MHNSELFVVECSLLPFQYLCLRYLQVVVLSFLLSFQVQAGQSPQVLLAHRLVHSGATADTLTVVVSGVCPPVSFCLDVAQDHVLNGGGKAWHLYG